MGFLFSRKDRTLADMMAVVDGLSGSVMVADRDLTIRYVNPAARALLKEAEAEIRKDLPRFSADNLVGHSIDEFHARPAHQRGALANLDKPLTATIRVGGRPFDLRVVPLRRGGRTDGFMVEWSDARLRILNADYKAQMDAIRRSGAVIEFSTDGLVLEANENFLKVMGYTLAEVKGQHHGLFVDPAHRAGRDYEQFWEALRRGEYKAGQYRRIGKGGRTVWIEGSYNPIFGADGTVTRVVKFATDVTRQAELLADLKTLIDRNFGEMDRGIDRSRDEARAAAGAAHETSVNVQTVAASAEELAASIAEITRAMADARAATEESAARAARVGESTERLANAARAMNGIVALIQSIAGQINLLALNATIEAARAGDAGRGFAVVATEVKNLANQAAQATERISQEIDGIQGTSAEVAGALTAIRDAVITVREHVAATASAIEEQSAVTRGMSEGMQAASVAVGTIASSVAAITDAVDEAAGAVNRTRSAAEVLVR
ncbi:PAS domain-containing methyl-accepting chemotaxis protein [Azospirillum halopraeferens]|uniref:PAS domain-containing methyl-accepting chemotaxis protein n=1 Tax=Azospirillum halopraeferens TaxID=34010 RepID=UPI00040B55FE|nr:PAS domain-containing methyl-accepting chemotaxis protein [Azospirillum halopraeferens]